MTKSSLAVREWKARKGASLTRWSGGEESGGERKIENEDKEEKEPEPHVSFLPLSCPSLSLLLFLLFIYVSHMYLL